MFSRFIRVAARIALHVSSLPNAAPPCGPSSFGSRPEVPSPSGRSLQNTGNSYVLDSIMSTPNCFTHREMAIQMFTMSEYKHDLVYSMEKTRAGLAVISWCLPCSQAAGFGSLLTGSGPPRRAVRGGPGQRAQAPRGIAVCSQESQPFCARASGKVIPEVLALNKIGVGNLEMERLYEFINFSLQIGQRRSCVYFSRRRHPCSVEQLGRPAFGLWLSLIELGLLRASWSFTFFPYKLGPAWAVVKVRERGGHGQSLGPTHRQPQAQGSSNVRR